MKHLRTSCCAAVLWLWMATPGWAHRDDYLDETFVYVTLERAELEPEYWLDIGDHTHGAGDFLRHNLATEYGLTDRWMVDGRFTFTDDRGDAIRVASGRVETRYRSAEEGTYPVDVALSAEIATERTSNGTYESALEPRLIFSKDLQELNLTLNLVEEIPTSEGRPGFAPSFGFRYGTTGLLRLGSEFKYNTGNSQGAIVPQVWFALEHEVTVKLGFSHGFDRNREDFSRVAIEVGL